MARINRKWFVENIDNGNKYILEEIPVVSLGNYERKLYRVTEESTGNIHYKGINISRSRIAEGKNKDLSIDDIFETGENCIENTLLSDNENNMEFVFHTDKEFTRPLAEDGSYLPEIITNVRVGNLANEYSSIPGGKNG